MCLNRVGKVSPSRVSNDRGAGGICPKMSGNPSNLTNHPKAVDHVFRTAVQVVIADLQKLATLFASRVPIVTPLDMGWVDKKLASESSLYPDRRISLAISCIEERISCDSCIMRIASVLVRNTLASILMVTMATTSMITMAIITSTSVKPLAEFAANVLRGFRYMLESRRACSPLACIY